MMDTALDLCVSADGTRIAYADWGTGRPLIYVPPWGASNIHLDWERSNIRSFFEELGRGRRLIRIVRRGVAESQRDVGDISMGRQLEDLAAVADTLRLDKFDLLGADDGAAICVMYAANQPARVGRLVLWALYGRAGGEDHPSVRSMSQLCRTDFDKVCRMVGKLNFPSGPDQEIDWFSEYHVRSESPGAAEQYFRFVAGIDVREELSRLTMPVLVLHRRGDQLIPLRAARSAASRIPHARFIELEGDRHLLAAGDSSSSAVITAFLAGRNVPDSLHRPMPMRTILFTDLIAHTATMQRLGDERGREFLRKHEDLTRALLAEHGGEEIKTMGDGFLASFSSVTAGVGCAIALQRAVASRNAWLPAPRIDAGFSRDPALEPLHIRVGLNAGEPIEDEGPDGRRDLYGSAVILAARIAAQAEGGQILASNVVRELCSGKPFLFSDRGDHVMKGFDEAIRVYEVRWQD